MNAQQRDVCRQKISLPRVMACVMLVLHSYVAKHHFVGSTSRLPPSWNGSILRWARTCSRCARRTKAMVCSAGTVGNADYVFQAWGRDTALSRSDEHNTARESQIPAF